jgi:rhodanese-related sulfurtransferase
MLSLLNRIKAGACLLSLLLGGLVFLPAARAVTYGDITAFELKNRIDAGDQGLIIVDIRSAAKYDAGHIPTAVDIPLREFGVQVYTLDRTKDIVVYCDLGVQSKLACEVLISAGFKDVYNLTGGLQEWPYALVTSDGRVGV